DDQAIHLALLAAALQGRAHVIDIGGNFRNQDVIGGDSDAAEAGDPAGVPAHGLNDHDATVRFGGGAQAVHRFGDNVDGRVETEGEIGRGQVVVNRLGHADHRQLEIVEQARGDAERIVAADGHQSGEAVVLE